MIDPIDQPEGDRAEVITLRPNWADYERRKKALASFNLTPDEYQRQCQRIAEELGI